MRELLLWIATLLTLCQSLCADDRDDGIILRSVSRLGELTRITDQPHRMDPVVSTSCDVRNLTDTRDVHREPRLPAFCHVYVTRDQQDVIKSGQGKYPAGAILVKSKFAGEDAKKVDLYTVMRKMADDYDPKHGNWEYSVVDGQAKRVLARGKIDSCIECHATHEKTDYVTRAYLE